MTFLIVLSDGGDSSVANYWHAYAVNSVFSIIVKKNYSNSENNNKIVVLCNNN